MSEIARNLFLGVICSLIASAIVALVRLWKKSRPKGATEPTHKPDNPKFQLDSRTRRGKYAFVILTLGLFALAIWAELLEPVLSSHSISSDTALLVRKPHWVAYEPLQFDPSSSSNPDVSLIEKQLGWIREAGFDGIITFTSRGTFAEIPSIAKRKNLAVIMGIWDPTNREEIAAAISKHQYVDAYCVGHDGLDYDYSYEALANVMNHVRFRTQRPVTTTEKLDHYLSDKRLLIVGDWLFPDCLLPIRDTATNTYTSNASRDVKKTIELANQLAANAEFGERKPILLKMVGYPYPRDKDCALITGSDEQSKFFGMLTNAQQDVGTNLSSEISISAYSAFDLVWKTQQGFYNWEKCTGLLNDDGTSRPAVQEIMKKRVR